MQWNRQYANKKGGTRKSAPLEPGVFLDAFGAAKQHTKSLRRFARKQSFHDTLGLRREALGEVDWRTKNLLVALHGILVVEWRVRLQHLVDQNAQAPPGETRQ
jgi:hypothetical protein